MFREPEESSVRIDPQCSLGSIHDRLLEIDDTRPVEHLLGEAVAVFTVHPAEGRKILKVDPAGPLLARSRPTSKLDVAAGHGNAEDGPSHVNTVPSSTSSAHNRKP